LKYIFEFSKLSLGDTGNSFFLITMPRIKEILGKKLEDFLGKRSLEECLGEKIDLESVQFKDKNQEKQYLIKKESAVVKRGKFSKLLKRSHLNHNRAKREGKERDGKETQNCC